MRDQRFINRSHGATITCLFACMLVVNTSSEPLWAQANVAASEATAKTTKKPISLNLRQFEIPFSVDTTGARPVEVQLYVSRDQGQRWELFASKPAMGKKFLFTAQHDGIYWFATRTVDGSGKADPAASIAPQMVVNIDTENPLAELKADLTAEGKVVVTIACTDQSPSIDSLRIDYSIDQSAQWNAVNDISGRSDPVDQNRINATADFMPVEPWQQISVRALIGDAAGNKTIVTTTLDKPRVAATDFRLATAKSPSNTAVTSAQPASPQSTAQPAPASMPFSPPTAFYPSQPEPAPAAPAPLQLNSPNPAMESTPTTNWAVPQFAVSSGVSPALPVQNGAATAPDLVAPLLPGEIPRAEAAIPTAPPRPKTAAAAMRPISSVDTASPDQRQSASRVTPAPVDAIAQGENAATTTADISHFNNSVGEPIGDGLVASGVQIRYCNSRKFSLEYEIESAGLAGVSDVELWGTRDRGLTWKRWGSDPDRESPFDIETNNDGAYGFRIVVVAANGLATPRPIENDLPDIFVVVDTELPTIRITGAAYGEGNQTGALVMRYQCDDLNLTQRPITLAFGPSLSGPWSTIAAGLENEGAYVWPADPNLPRQIYIRIDALDLAGNLGTYILDTPIDIQGLAPRARIRGFNPVTGTPGGSRTVAGNQNETSGPGRPQTATQPQARFK